MPFLIPLWAFITSPIGRYVALAAAAALAWFAFAKHYEHKGAEKATTEIITKIDKRNNEAKNEADIIRKGWDNLCADGSAVSGCMRDEWTIDVPGGMQPVSPDPQLPVYPPTRSR